MPLSFAEVEYILSLARSNPAWRQSVSLFRIYWATRIQMACLSIDCFSATITDDKSLGDQKSKVVFDEKVAIARCQQVMEEIKSLTTPTSSSPSSSSSSLPSSSSSDGDVIQIDSVLFDACCHRLLHRTPLSQVSVTPDQMMNVLMTTFLQCVV
jgi:hypothetical protein